LQAKPQISLLGAALSAPRCLLHFPIGAPVIVVLFLFVCGSSTVLAYDSSIPSKPLRVGVFLEPPFAMNSANGFSGFAVDLWSKIATTLGWTCDYQQVATIPELLDKLNKGQLDVGVTDLSITSERLQLVDFTQPYLDAGLQVMINEKHRGGFAELIRGLSEAGHLQVFGGAALLLVIATLFLTLHDRRIDPDFYRSWTMGLSESFYHVVSLATAGKADHKPIVAGATGNLVAGLWLICGVTIIAYFTSSITSVMTVNRIHSQISGPKDLSGKRVGTVTGSAAAAYCHSAHLDTIEFPDVDAAVQALATEKIDAIVYNSWTLRYIDKQHPELPITEVGPLFEPRKFGFALPQGSQLRMPINLTLLRLSEGGYMRQIGSEYFGTE
jgi:polar amino acid transport system substrate-binding protein